MLLNELYKFGEKVNIPYGFTLQRKLNFLITITLDGELIEVSQLNTTEQNLNLTCVVRTGKSIRPNFLYDKIDYVSDKKTSSSNAKECHSSFVNLHKELQELCGNIYLKAINLFYENDGAKKLNDVLDSEDYNVKISDWFGFRIKHENNYIRPHESEELLNFYSDFLWNKNVTLNKVGQCSITGKLNQPLISVTIKQFPGLPNISGGLSVYSNNFSSVECFGLEQLESSSISQDADLKITNALDYLLKNKNHHLKLNDLNKVYVFWTDEEINQQFNPFKFLDEKINIEDIASFVSSWKYNKNKIGKMSDTNCFLIEINNYTQRPFFKLHKFEESQLKNNLEKWFDTIECEYSKFRFFSIDNLVKALSKKSNQSTNNKQENSKNYKQKKIKQDLFDMMFFGKQTSEYLKVLINKENLSFAGPFETKKREFLSHEKMALINCCLGYSNMEIKNHAYNYGKILAFADSLQSQALDKVNVTISQKFYRGNNPKRTFAELDNRIRLYINMIKRKKKRLGFFYEGKYNELISNLELPLKFNDDEQLLKAKGFYEERLSKNKSQSNNNENEIIN